MTADSAFVIYVVALTLTTFNFVGFGLWIVISKAYRDRRYKTASYSVLALYACFAYILGFNAYVRYLRFNSHDAYDECLDSPAWALRYVPVCVYLGSKAIFLTIWLYSVLWNLYWKRKLGLWTERNEDSPRKKK